MSTVWFQLTCMNVEDFSKVTNAMEGVCVSRITEIHSVSQIMLVIHVD